LQDWISRIFGKNDAGEIATILWRYYQLAFERRPEFMGWSQTEPTTQTNYTAYNHFSHGDEAQRRIDKYDSLEKAVSRLRDKTGPRNASAFYELVYYPVTCASLMNKKFLYRDKAYLYAKQNRFSAYRYAAMSRKAFNDIIIETSYYNTELAGGKWKNMMSMIPRDLPVFQEPVIPVFEIDGPAVWKAVPEGVEDTAAINTESLLPLPAFDNVNRQKYFVDVFLSSPVAVNWSAAVSADWIKLSATAGHLDSISAETRIWVAIDWAKFPKGKNREGKIIFTGGGKQISIAINATAIEVAANAGSIENNGVVSMDAVNFSSNVVRSGSRWNIIHDIGSGNAMLQSPFMQQPVDTASVIKSAPYAAYNFYSLNDAKPVVNIFSLPTHPLNRSFSMRYAVSIDDGPLTIADFRTYGRSEEWKQNVLRNSAVKKIPTQQIRGGKHVLKIYCIDPGVNLDRIVIDLGGLKNNYSALPWSAK
jgi:hypothetical protein